MSEEYSKEYYQAINQEENAQAKVVADYLTQAYKPLSVIDLGCGTGLYLDKFNVPKKLGIDISDAAFTFGYGNLKKADLSKPIDLGRWDLGICFEVLEHIDAEFADVAVDNLTRSSDKLVITAAMPNQPGLNHVNCQPQQYWEEKFRARGYTRDYFNEYWLAQKVSEVQHTAWLIKNLMVYTK